MRLTVVSPPRPRGLTLVSAGGVADRIDVRRRDVRLGHAHFNAIALRQLCFERSAHGRYPSHHHWRPVRMVPDLDNSRPMLQETSGRMLREEAGPLAEKSRPPKRSDARLSGTHSRRPRAPRAQFTPANSLATRRRVAQMLVGRHPFQAGANRSRRGALPKAGRTGTWPGGGTERAVIQITRWRGRGSRCGQSAHRSREDRTRSREARGPQRDVRTGREER